MVVDRKKNTERNLQLNLSMTFFESEKEIEKITGGGHRCPRCEFSILGAKYLVFVSSHSVKLRELSFAQFVDF